MNLSVYAVYDSKASCFANPFFCPNDSVAIRAFTGAVNDRNTEISRYPSDFLLFKLADFDNEVGTISPLGIPQNLGAGSNFVFKQVEVTENAS